jgi:hypothetical protein
MTDRPTTNRCLEPPPGGLPMLPTGWLSLGLCSAGRHQTVWSDGDEACSPTACRDSTAPAEAAAAGFMPTRLLRALGRVRRAALRPLGVV